MRSQVVADGPCFASRVAKRVSKLAINATDLDLTFELPKSSERSFPGPFPNLLR